ncbi:hypothetical protein Agabi119p4_2032 [Agaricus bisporus var. burnettii]|uniref:F-box domain-containing protein n=1 Tax=Agaricus bisporus var. burnettii TaxID=192524 RepID=A0A8H7KJQ1_AGABI|nr:hypothetical protein Agabi119p4_2032 [Agaricus bisporus var. burnettii]
MSKRHLSPHELPASKRLHTTHTNPSHRSSSLVESLYDELILSIFSFLSWDDLCVVQSINRNWARLALDNELWRRQYFLVYGKTRLRGSRGPVGRSDGKEIKPLPARARSQDSSYKDWKWMFRISSNWRKGRCLVEEPLGRSIESSPQTGDHDTCGSHLLLTGALTILASTRPSYEPRIYITGPTQSCSLVCKPKENVCSKVTTMAIDQHPVATGHCKVIAFLSTGEFVHHEFQHDPVLIPFESFRYTPTRENRSYPVIQAAYHYPLLVTLAQNFTISLFDLESETVKLTQTLSSFTSYPPVSLILSMPSSTVYKLVLTYAIPVYPHHWTVGATELLISGPKMIASPSLPEGDSSKLLWVSQNLTALSTRTTRAIDVPFGWIDERKLRAMREQWNRKVTRVADIRTDGKWVILASGDQLPGLEDSSASPRLLSGPSCPSPSLDSDSRDNLNNNLFTPSSLHSPTSLQVYRLIFPPHTSISSPLPRLSFVRTLHGQTGPIVALALSDGRCVSLSLNGSVWVWDLETATSAEVAAANCNATGDLAFGPDALPLRRSVSFDERRLVIAQGDSVVVRRFDV